MAKRTLFCDCGRAIENVNNDKTETVTCYYCLTGMKKIPEGYWDDIVELENKAAEAAESPKRGRGRPRKHPVVEEENKVKRGRGRPKKESNMQEKKAEAKGTGKRGRKATVGAKVLEYINENRTAKFEDILTVYSEERERLGKKKSDDIEKRNCLSTLYIMKRDGKIREVTPKSEYAAI